MRRTSLVLAALACLVAPACGFGHGPDFTIGFRRVALDLAYQDQALATPPTRQDIVIPQPVLATGTFVINQQPLRATPTTVPRVAPPAVNLCPTASPDSHPDQPVTVFATVPPKAGTYLLHNTGKFTIGSGPLATTFPMPPQSAIEIKNVAQSDLGNDPVNGPTTAISWDVVQPGLNGSTTTTYRTTFSPAPAVSTVEQTAQQAHAPAGELDLVHLVITSGSTTVDFRPNPPVTLMSFMTGEGTSWNSAGIDPRD